VFVEPPVQTFDIAPVGLASVIAQTALKPEGCRKTLQLRLDKTILVLPERAELRKAFP
jgi:hypothetical protein